MEVRSVMSTPVLEFARNVYQEKARDVNRFSVDFFAETEAGKLAFPESVLLIYVRFPELSP